MSVKTKVKIMTTVTILMAIGEICMMKVPVGQICLGVVWLLHVIAFVFFIKTKKEEKVVEATNTEVIATSEEPKNDEEEIKDSTSDNK